LTVLVGGADDWTQPGPCREVAGRSRLKFIEYAGYHGLDAPNAKVRVARGFGGVKGGAADVGPTRPRAAAIKELTGVLSAARDELLRCPRRPPQF